MANVKLKLKNFHYSDKNLGLQLSSGSSFYSNVGCVFPVVTVSILLHVEFGRNDHREDAPHFTITIREAFIYFI